MFVRRRGKEVTTCVTLGSVSTNVSGKRMDLLTATEVRWQMCTSKEREIRESEPKQKYLNFDDKPLNKNIEIKLNQVSPYEKWRRKIYLLTGKET